MGKRFEKAKRSMQNFWYQNGETIVWCGIYGACALLGYGVAKSCYDLGKSVGYMECNDDITKILLKDPETFTKVTKLAIESAAEVTTK